MTGPVAHVSASPVVHDGPGHAAADPGWCGGCWWEQRGQYAPPSLTQLPDHAPDCPACCVRPPVGYAVRVSQAVSDPWHGTVVKGHRDLPRHQVNVMEHPTGRVVTVRLDQLVEVWDPFSTDRSTT